ncbi:hypothetical protein D3C72_66490 [compost metagenome]
MRYPNTRYGNPTELLYYTQGLSVKDIAKQLKRSEKSVSEWLNGNRKIPFWVPELLRLRHMEADLKLRQMGFGDLRLQLGIVKGDVIDFNHAGNDHSRERPPRHLSPPHNCNLDNQTSTGADQAAVIGLDRTRKHGTTS